jgi:hypothetical protein
VDKQPVLQIGGGWTQRREPAEPARQKSRQWFLEI